MRRQIDRPVLSRVRLFHGFASVALLLSPSVWAADPKPTMVIQADPQKEKKQAYIDDAFALSDDGTTLYYVFTDGVNSAKLRGIKLPAQGAAPPAAAPAPTGKPAAADIVLEITGVPLNTYKMWLLPENRALLVLRDLDTTGLYTAIVYDLKTKAKVPVAGGSDGMIGPATEIVLSQPAPSAPAAAPAPAPAAPPAKGGGKAPAKAAAPAPAPAHLVPAILAFTKTEPPSGGAPTEYALKAWSTSTLKPLGQRSWKLSGSEGRITSPQGSGQPLYFLADYQVLAVKHGGAYDKKKDIREPDFLAYLDVLGGKVRGSRPIGDPTSILEISRLRAGHSESMMLRGDPETDKIELFSAQDFERPEGPVEKRVVLSLPRPSNMYEMTTLRSQSFGVDQLLISATVDPVNEKAVAEKRTDPDTMDFCTIELKTPEAPARQRLSIPGLKRPSAWVATNNGRLAILRKHKSFSRGGSEIEIYDFPAK